MSMRQLRDFCLLEDAARRVEAARRRAFWHDLKWGIVLAAAALFITYGLIGVMYAWGKFTGM
jgi:hypothetical protein